LPSIEIPKRKGLVYGEAELLSDSDPSCGIKPSLDITNADGKTTVLVPLAGDATPFAAPAPN